MSKKIITPKHSTKTAETKSNDEVSPVDAAVAADEEKSSEPVEEKPSAAEQVPAKYRKLQ